ncbi:amino acid ABC transporter permease [uncultured Enterococcus sp.]|uniref:amino acid ABC transporter permease n=1 Tax=uncultured Enterococcus sp. TaxID=167972 RepID=UPI0025D53C47|nr:amino acid ABC transporter permease [uncultured Enterococcus sp.]
MRATLYVPTIDFKLIFETLPYVLKGIPYTLGIALVSFLIGNIIAIILTILLERAIAPIRYIIRFYVSFLRGIPMIVLLFLFYFGLPIQLTAIEASCLSFSLSSSAFLTEIYRGALAGVDVGQRDAGYSLGFTYSQLMRKVVFPQAFVTAVPALGNVAMDVLKGTSLTAMISVPDIFQLAKIVGGRKFDFFSMYILVGVLYWLMCLLIGAIQKRAEARLLKNMGISAEDQR